ncbi:MAG: tRNA glutamyl-Q(34) synthetase GluQRS [Ilumatobacteraceae bacterium]
MSAQRPVRGRFAPSPTGSLHLGNLRTALLSWLQARSAGGSWIVRMEDLDRVTSSAEHEARQLADLADLGLVPDEPVVRQSERFDLHRDAIARLSAIGRVYECFCTRREIRDAAQAPHGDDMPYPQTCRSLTDARRRAMRDEGRRPALRLRAEGETFTVDDLVAGAYTGAADDVVLQRNDGVPAYNLAVVVDDAAQGVSHVLRGNDLLSSTPRQRLLQQLLDLPEPAYAHVPLVLAPDGARLAKRHGAVTLADLAARGVGSSAVLARLGASLGLCDDGDDVTSIDLLAAFDVRRIPTAPWRLQASEL